MTDTLEQVKYPIGRYEAPARYTQAEINGWISAIEAMPSWLDPCIENLDEAQLEVPYRDGGWNSRQVIHHIADSHMNAYIRLKLALTEDDPAIKPYDENKWAVLADVETVPVNVSITLLHALHRRWAAQLRSMSDEDWKRTYFHPEQNKSIPIWQMTALYAWHGRHHMEQIRSLRERMGW
ncbi:MAG TPA: putative metal-dependent hydrolase [Flavipsychrobacter sp.]